MNFITNKPVMLKVEVCATSLQSIRYAQEAGADRIELCSELTHGGITPSYGFIKEAVRLSSLPIHCLIRPRSGNFIYNEDEFQIILENIRMAKQLGVSGIVLGFLTSKNDVHWEQLHQALAFAKPLGITFHRAFDLIRKPEEALGKFIELGINRVLCTGHPTQAVEGIETLKRWKSLTLGQIEIQPGGGINHYNCHRFVTNRFESLHLSAQIKTKQETLGSNEAIWEQPKEIADLELLKKVVAICKP